MSETMELISVVVPIYNAEKYLIRCIESIQNQTYSNLEIILVDDGSPDRCPEICDQKMKEDCRIKVIHKQNAGQGLARNDGLKIATGKYITFVDADDWISLTHVENLYCELCRYQADAALGNHTRVNADGEQIRRHIPLERGLYEGADVVDKLLLPLIGAEASDTRDVVINSSVSMNLYSLDLIREKGIRFISERYAVAEDFYFNVDFFYHADKIVITDENGYFYVHNPESTCEKYNPKRFERTLNYYKEISERVEKYAISEIAEQRMWRSFLMKIRVAIRHIVLSDLSYKEKLLQIEEILCNDIVSRVLRNYPIEAYGRSMRLLAQMMRQKRIRAVYLLMWMREKARHTKTLRNALHLIGVGK